MKTLKAFSLIELMVSLITISCIAAASSPIISKKLSMSSIMVSKPSGGSGGDSSGVCPLGQYMSSTTNTCTNCSETFENCSICTESGCLVCSSGLSLNAGKCEVSSCPPYTIKITVDSKDLCVTQYNMGDKTEFPINVSGVTVVSTDRSCNADACCWQGKSASSCNSDNGGYSGCKRTVCTQYAAKYICNNLNYGGMNWRLPTKDELAGFDPTTNSRYKGVSGLMLCADSSGSGSALCNYSSSSCIGSKMVRCYPHCLWSGTLYDTDDSSASEYCLGSDSWGTNNNDRRYANSVRCVSDLTCVSKFGSNCTDCSDSACTACKAGYILKNGQCIVSPCPANTVYVEADGKELCVTQYNMGDKTEFPVNVSGVTVVSTNRNCSADACCWRGHTSSSGCNSDNGGYSGCNRTVCTQYAAKYICNNLNYGGMSWRLPTSSELAGFYPTYSKDIGTSGLMLCDSSSSVGAAECDDYDVCDGSSSDCCPNCIWSDTISNLSSSLFIFYHLYVGSWYQSQNSSSRAYSVRCVSNLACTKFGSNCTDCSNTACTACKAGYILKNGQCKTCSDAFGSSCTSCSSSACTACSDGYTLKNGKCVVAPTCPANTVYVYADGKDLCVTQYNMGDKTEFPVNVSGVTVVSTRTECNANACCWQGETAAPCDSINGGYSGCNRTVCTHYAAEKICNNLNYGGMSWRLPTSSELDGFYPTYSKNIGTSGLMLCDYDSVYGSAQCYSHSVCDGSYGGRCTPSYVWSSILYSSSNAYRYDLISGSWGQIYNNRRYAFSVRCVSPLGENTCKDTFGNGCVECSSSACTRCMDGYTLKNGKCVVVPTCPANTVKITVSGKDLCVTQYNMGDKTEFPVNVSGVSVVSTNSYCGADACCWQGRTANNSCNSNNGDYSGCKRTVCTQYAAEIICNNLNYGGMSWRLPTEDELAGFDPDTYSRYKGASGLMLCDELSGYGSAQCNGSPQVCNGSRDGGCSPIHVWSSTFDGSSRAIEYFLSAGSWYSHSYSRRDANSVRCVSEL